ncbi:hypothetical protein K3495_g4201 [Podosphaera aphanis]|nr:hypothetical protein K3495_g4201 [Podosphaera aphanis]
MLSIFASSGNSTTLSTDMRFSGTLTAIWRRA